MNKVIYNNIDQNHTISLINRNELEITGVNKIENLNEFEFYIITYQGNMYVKGLELEMKQLDIEKGLLQIKGKIMSIEYTDLKNKKEKSLIGKIFK